MRQIYTLALIFIAVPSFTYFFYEVNFYADVDKVFLSISTFLFSIFTGFFISRQASRFNKVRETVTKFDGIMSSLFRASGHISTALQEQYGEIIMSHYKKILETGKWHIHFTQKSSTISTMHKVLQNTVSDGEVTKLANQALGAVVKGLANAQLTRKQMLALYKERIPVEQWILILFFAAMLIGVASIVPSAGLLFPSVVKAAFCVSVLSVLFILYRLNNLMYTEKIMGEESAKDVLGIIEGTR